MADDLQNYQLQLQQVEAALLTEPDNEELRKLKTDLEEVIELTIDLKQKAEEAANLPEYTDAVGHIEEEEEDEVTRSLLAVEQFVAQNKAKRKWKVGDTCMAKSSENGQFYEATIDVINPDGQVNVTFANFKNRGITILTELKEFNGEKRQMSEGMKKGKVNKEYLKKKKLKKQQRFKELEEEREQDKKKWLTFANKALKTKKSGINTKSIFASPESVAGRVGIGTCGISGKGMTEFTTAEKWRKGV